MGNCGVGFAPCRPVSRPTLIELMEGVEDIPGIVLDEGHRLELAKLRRVPRRGGAHAPGVQANRDSKVSFIGVSQDKAKETEAFMKQFGITFPVALDDPKHYAVSNAYGLTNVPTLFYIEPNAEIEISSVSWSKV